MIRPRTIALLLTLLASTLGVATRAWGQSLYWLDTQYGAPTLRRSDLDGLGVTTLALTPGTLPEGLAADASGRVFWTEASWAGARVQRVSGDLVGGVTLVPGGSVLRGIAVDAAAQRLYWTSSNLATGSAIHRSSIGGFGAVPLLALGAGNPRGIATNPAAGRIYWADFDQDVIFSATLDGASPAVLVSLPAGSGPYGVTVDPVSQRLYWTEYTTGLLKRSEANGSNVTLIASGLANPTYVVHGGSPARLFWTEGGAGSQRLRRANADGTGIVTLPPALASYGGIGIGSGSGLSTPDAGLPLEFALERVWPTPGSGPLHVGFALPRESHVKLSVLDLQGRVVSVLADGVLPAGRHDRVWGARPGGGVRAAGIYFARLQADGRTWSRRLVVTD